MPANPKLKAIQKPYMCFCRHPWSDGFSTNAAIGASLIDCKGPDETFHALVLQKFKQCAVVLNDTGLSFLVGLVGLFLPLPCRWCRGSQND